jgi:predicted acetyltransferase
MTLEHEHEVCVPRKLMGTINVRYPYLGYVQVHGHIGYGIRPSERRKGYATMMLKLALEHCKKIGLEKVL